MIGDLDPLTQDIYFQPLASNAWHLWRAGNPNSVCGLGWPSMCWNVSETKPERGVCEQCSGSGEGEAL
jgi:hypothetical protein